MARSPGSSKAASARYLSLFTVSVRHDFYNDSAGRCPDLRVYPTPDCAALMASLGLLFRDLGSSFVILVTEAKAEALARYVETRGAAAVWLSFLLVPSNPQFVPITALPIDTDLRARNLHLTNLRVDKAKDAFVLSGTGPDETAFLPITSSTLTTPTPAGRTARLVDLSRAPVSAPATATGSATAFDLTPFPYGLYSVLYTAASGRPAAAPRGAPPAERLYVPTAPASLGLLDLLLARPRGAVAPAAAFPLAGEAIRPVSLVLAFAARETVWRYFVVAQGRSGRFSDLEISGKAARFDGSETRLPNGEEATRFTASEALPLRRRSPYRFQLSGHRLNGSGARNEIEINRLPTAPAAPVWPSDDPLQGESEIYVYV